MASTTPEWEALQGEISGDVILPESSDYESARKSAIARFHDVRPQALVSCETSADISETISFARRSGLRAAIRSGGHCFAGRSSTEGIVIEVSPMRTVSVSGGAATVGAGARLGEVYDALDERCLTIPTGCGSTVGISGLTLGGGLGILGRKHGLTSDHLLSARIIFADGSIVECDEHHRGDLFWALRGAGGNFGVVTSLVFRTLPAPDATAFHLLWPHAHAAAVIQAWQAWAPSAPDELAASLLLTAPGNPDRQPAVNLFGAMIGTESDAAGLLDGLVARVGENPTAAFRKHMSYRETKRYLAELGDAMAGEDDRLGEGSPDDPTAQGCPFSRSEFFRRPLPIEAVAALVENLSRDRVSGQSRELDFSPWGGAYNRVPAEDTAFAHRDELFLLQHTTVVDPYASAAEREDAKSWMARSWDTVHPYGSGRVYPNFRDPDLKNWARAYYGLNYYRLVRIKSKYDPDDFFRYPQSLPSCILGGNPPA